MQPSDLVDALVAAGIAGCNVEDSDPTTRLLLDPVTNAARLSGIRQAAEAAGVPLAINARMDVWIRGDGSSDARLEEGVRRARMYAGWTASFP